MDLTIATTIVLTSVAIASYLLGSISFGVLYTKFAKGVDVRDFGSKGSGMTNVSRVAGKKTAALTFICDVLKGIVAVILAKYIGLFVLSKISGVDVNATIDPKIFELIAGFCCVLGHNYPIFFGFRGGKGVATSIGVLFLVDWRVGLITLLFFLITLAFSHYVSLSSIIGAISVPFSTYFLYNPTEYTQSIFGISQHWFVTILGLMFCIVVVFAHRKNIGRLIGGTESKIGKKNK